MLCWKYVGYIAVVKYTPKIGIKSEWTSKKRVVYAGFSAVTDKGKILLTRQQMLLTTVRVRHTLNQKCTNFPKF